MEVDGIIEKPSSPLLERPEVLVLNSEKNSSNKTQSNTELSIKHDHSENTGLIIVSASKEAEENCLEMNEAKGKSAGCKECSDEKEMSYNRNTGGKECNAQDGTKQLIQTGKGVPKVITKIIPTLKENFAVPSKSACREVLNQNGVRNKKPVPENHALQNSNLDEEVPEKNKVEFLTEDTHPQWYEIKGNLVTASMITGNLPKVYESLPVNGRPNGKDDIADFHMRRIREFVGCNLDDEEFNELAKYCDPMHLKMGKELMMPTNVPTIGFVPVIVDKDDSLEGPELESNVEELSTVIKCRTRARDIEFQKKLKYRGLRLMALSHEEEWNDTDDTSTVSDMPEEPEVPLEPGKDILYRVRVYRPFAYSASSERNIKIRHSIFSCDIVLLGRHKLTALRDRFVCHNEADMRVDVSNTPDDLPITTAKEIFPSGFLLINNVFYVDSREGCSDHSAPLRRWALQRGLGRYRREDMARLRLHQLVLKLGNPEVYVHQGNCEHLFTFSEIRLLGPSDPVTPSYYPCHTAISQNQTIYCTTCAEFSAKWIVVGCNRVPFDPAFFCDTCFKLYLYKDGEKVSDFKAYSYRGNEINMLKPLG